MDTKKLVTICLSGFASCLGFCVLCYWLLKRSTEPSKQLLARMKELEQDYESFKLHLGTDSNEVLEKCEHALQRLRVRERRQKEAGETSPTDVPLDLGEPQASPAELRARIYAGYLNKREP